jgi:hypothetical protein
MYVLSVQYSCAIVSVFLFGGKANLVRFTLFYSTLLTLTDGMIDGETNTLALRGLEEPFFQLCCCVVLVFGSGGNKVFDLHTHVLLRVQYSCGGVLVILFWWEIVFGVTHILSVQYSCAAVSVF